MEEPAQLIGMRPSVEERRRTRWNGWKEAGRRPFLQHWEGVNDIEMTSADGFPDMIELCSKILGHQSRHTWHLQYEMGLDFLF